MLPFGLCNTMWDALCFATLHITPEPTDIEFVAMADHVFESIHILITGASESLSDSGSSEASHHPSH